MTENFDRGKKAPRNLRLKRGAGIGGTAILTLSMLSAGVLAGNAGIGTGGIIGGTGGNLGSYVYLMNYDNYVTANGNPSQGWGEASIQNMVDRFRAGLKSQGKTTLDGDWNAGGWSREQVDNACRTAIKDAIARTPGAKTARVVSLSASLKDASPGSHIAGWGYDDYRAGINQIWYNSGFSGYDAKLSNEVKARHLAEVKPSGGSEAVRTVCVAMNDLEPQLGYDLDVTTEQKGGFTMAGGTEAVHDRITFNNHGGDKEQIKVQTILHWDGFPAEGKALKSVSKTSTMGNSGSFDSPEFTPADFGWDRWPAGRFWYDIKVEKQGKMKNAVYTDDRIPAETWDSDVPKGVKNLETEDGRVLDANDQVTAGMTFNARIKVSSAGTRLLTIRDITTTDKVFLGGADSDDVTKIVVTNSAGQKMDAEITIDTENGKKVVTAKIKDAPDDDYTLIVPTTVMAEHEMEKVGDTFKSCYSLPDGTGETCREGDTKEVPDPQDDPDKVWSLNAEGGLTLKDRKFTNNVGADQKTFLHGDTVGAVVNDYIPTGFIKPLEAYAIYDDWSEAEKFVDFSDVSRVKVFVDGKDRSGDFDISVNGTTTKAVAKPEFLKDMGSLTKEMNVKLLIEGKFKPLTEETDTKGVKTTLINKGGVEWNNRGKVTNEPPVFIWNPDPHKDVLASEKQNGDNSSINHLGVYPGQHLKYEVKVDLNIPETAYFINKVAVKDNYDPLFTPNKDSVQVFDNRSNQVVDPENYSIAWNDAENSFEVSFTTAWINKNAVPGENLGFLSLTFDGTVKDHARSGDVVKNQAFQILNKVTTETEVPEVTIPPVSVDKEDLRCSDDFKDCVDINEKTVVEGDKIDYRLLMDGSVDRSKLAYDVHKFGMVDDFDENYLSLDLADVDIVVAETDDTENYPVGKSVKDEFNLQVKDGVFYAFAKTVDTTVKKDGQDTVIPGDPQPADLAQYHAKEIDPLKDPIINQNLVGKKYWIYLRTHVIQEKDGYVIENQGLQNLENMILETRIVSNPLKDIDPKKDVVVSRDDNLNSINGKNVELDTIFDYRLDSSIIPANRAYDVSEWSIRDKFDPYFDRYTGSWAVYANTDIYDGEKLVYAKGDLIDSNTPAEKPENSAEGSETAENQGKVDVQESGENLENSENAENGGNAENGATAETGNNGLFTATWDSEAYSTKIVATDKFMNIVNTRGDLEAGWSAYYQFERVAPGERIPNTFVESYNNHDRNSNEVWTKTPEHPSIDLEKWDKESGMKLGDRDEFKDALNMGSRDSNIIFTITNTGNVDLKEIVLTDKTTDGVGAVENITCEEDLDGFILKRGAKLQCEGTLKNIGVGAKHTNNATVTGKSVFTDSEVKDEDTWNAVTDSPFKSATGIDAYSAIALGSVVVLAGSGVGLALTRKKKGKKDTTEVDG